MRLTLQVRLQAHDRFEIASSFLVSSFPFELTARSLQLSFLRYRIQFCAEPFMLRNIHLHKSITKVRYLELNVYNDTEHGGDSPKSFTLCNMRAHKTIIMVR